MDKKLSLVDRAFVHRVFVRVLLGPSLKRSTFPDSTTRLTLCLTLKHDEMVNHMVCLVSGAGGECSY